MQQILDQDKIDIQCFVYFLFKGTLHHSLIISYPEYIDDLIYDTEKLIKCFKVFAISKNTGKDYKDSVSQVAKFILNKIHFKEESGFDFWMEFIKISSIFCKNSFDIKINSFDIKNLNGNGTDAVPYFSVWTNTIRIDNFNRCLNKTNAYKRANERLLLWDGNDNLNFTQSELEQEIY